jgi:hypothetical protein
MNCLEDRAVNPVRFMGLARKNDLLDIGSSAANDNIGTKGCI